MEPHRHNSNIEIHIVEVKNNFLCETYVSMILCGKETEYSCLTK